MRTNSSSERLATASRRLAQLNPEPAPGALHSPRAAEPDNPWAAPPTHTRVRPERFEPRPWPDAPPPTRVRPGSLPPTEREPSVPAPALALPGRHARRRGGRPDRLMSDRVSLGPGHIGRLSLGRFSLGRFSLGRFSLGPGHVGVVGVLVLLAVLATGWWLLRAQPSEVSTPSGEPPGAPSPLVTGLTEAAAAMEGAGGGTEPPAHAAPGTEGAVEPHQEVVVDVAGKVRRPGIAVLPPGSRVVDALEAAGGARSGVDLTALNLARLLVDGEQILVGLRPPSGVATEALSAPGQPAGSPAAGPLVPLNTADQSTLESLPDVGPVTAQAILAWRDQHGAFTSVDELLEVDGIGETTLARLAPLVTL